MSEFSIFKQPSDVMLEIAIKVKKMRKKNGFTQIEFSKKSGISLGSYKRFEQTGEISFVSLLKTAKLLGVLEDFDGLFNEKEHLPKNIKKLFE
jgi:transcriptional regulator with XRE-family HTH domain